MPKIPQFSRRNVLKTLGIGSGSAVGLAGAATGSTDEYVYAEFSLKADPTGENWDGKGKPTSENYELYEGEVTIYIWNHSAPIALVSGPFEGPLPEKKEVKSQPVIWSQRRDAIVNGRIKHELFASIRDVLHTFSMDNLEDTRISRKNIERLAYYPYTDTVGVRGNFRLIPSQNIDSS